MAASTGLRQRSMLVSDACKSRITRRSFSRLRPSQLSSTSSATPASMARSIPEVKLVPFALITATRACDVASIQSKARRISSHIIRFIALALPGRLMRMCAMCLSTLSCRVSNSGKVILAPSCHAVYRQNTRYLSLLFLVNGVGRADSWVILRLPRQARSIML